MKKTCNTKKIIRFSILFVYVCLFLFNLSCGLDTYIYLEAPDSIMHRPYYDTEDWSEKYFDFRTKEKYNIETGIFKGTAIYYKIYNSYSKMSSETSSINSLSSSDTTKAVASERMIETYNYKSLKYKASSGEVNELQIPADGSDKKVEIRLTQYTEIAPYIKITGAGEKIIGIPLRCDNDYTFDFGIRNDEKSRIPQEDDSDVSYVEIDANKEDEDNHLWYVTLFAVGIGTDTNYNTSRSTPLYLGCVTIDDREENN